MPMGTPEVHVKIAILFQLAVVLALAQNQQKPEVLSPYSRVFVNLSVPYFEFLDDVFNQFAKFNENVTANCRRDTKKFLDLVQEGNSSALSIADSIGKPESGILEGGIFFLGYYSECVRATIEVNDNERFSGKYCLINRNNTSQNIEAFPEISWAIIKSSFVLGICIPSSCSKEELALALDASLEKNFKGFQLVVKECHTNDDVFKEDSSVYIAKVFLFIYILIVILGTIYDSFLFRFSILSENSDCCHSLNLSKQNLVRSHAEEEKRNCFAGCKGAIFSYVHEFLCAFSIIRNGSKILSLDSKNEIEVLHGLKFFSMLFIILGHTFSFGTQHLVIRNKNVNQDATKPFIAQVFANGTFYVDTFYFISGLLSAYLLLQELQSKQSKNCLKVGLSMCIHRYIRLTPPMAAIIGLCLFFLRDISAGPNWLSSIEMFDSWCRENWWINLLYLHNFLNTDKMCLSHSWYLATEMQIFILVPPILYLMHRHIRYGLLAILILFLSSTLFIAIITFVKNYPAIPYVNNPTIPLDLINSYYREVYIRPYARCGPYLVGILVGYYILYKKELCLTKCLLTWLWIGSIGIILAVIYLMWPANQGDLPSTAEAAAYSSLSHSAWGLGLAWFLIACFYGYGGFANTILSWPPFKPLGRLTFCAYLIHPVIMNVYYGSMETFVDFTPINMIYIFLGNVCLTYVLSFILSILFESPFVALEKSIKKK